ncbi:MAG: efflux RND transporter periplasmic adaptor subunit [Gammaproteobacteria bacterium]
MTSSKTRAHRPLRAYWKPALLVAALIVCAALAVRWAGSEGDGASLYLTAPIERAPIISSVTATGALNALVTVEVSSQISGQVEDLFADFNDTVKAGQPIARLDQRVLAAQLEEARGALAAARARVPAQQALIERAQSDLSRAQAQREVYAARIELAESELAAATREVERRGTLRGKGVAANREVDLAETNREKASARLREARAEVLVLNQAIAVAEAELARARADLLDAEARVTMQEAAAKRAAIELERAVIRAPVDGVVIGRDVDRGQTVAASLEAPTLFTIAQDLHEMEVHAMVDEADIGRVAVDQRAWFTVDAYPERRFAARVAEIRKAPEVVENVVTYTVALATGNEELLLLPGMTALVEIIVAHTDEVLTAPNAALRFQPRGALFAADAQDEATDDTAARVWVVGRDGRPRAIRVETGVSDERVTEIASDELSAGRAVIVGEMQARSESGDSVGLRLGF